MQVGRGGIVDTLLHRAGLESGDAGIDLMNRRGECGQERLCVDRGAGDDGKEVVRTLIERDVKGGAGVSIERAFTDVVDDTDDLHRLQVCSRN